MGIEASLGCLKNVTKDAAVQKFNLFLCFVLHIR